MNTFSFSVQPEMLTFQHLKSKSLVMLVSLISTSSLNLSIFMEELFNAVNFNFLNLNRDKDIFVRILSVFFFFFFLMFSSTFLPCYLVYLLFVFLFVFCFPQVWHSLMIMIPFLFCCIREEKEKTKPYQTEFKVQTVENGSDKVER